MVGITLTFGLAKDLDFPLYLQNSYHIKGRVGSERDVTPPLFQIALDYISKSLDDGLLTPEETKEVTTKQLYQLFIEDLPPPNIVLKLPEQNWSLTWERLQNGSLSPEARSYLYLIVHERVSTRDRGHRLMPQRFPSNLCLHCGTEVATYQHRYLYCSFVSDIWDWLWDTARILEPSLTLTGEISLLRLNFIKGLQENSLLWLLGSYIEMVEKEVICKEKRLNLSSVLGHLKQKKQTAHRSAIPDLGLIPYIDWDPRGIG